MNDALQAQCAVLPGESHSRACSHVRTLAVRCMAAAEKPARLHFQRFVSVQVRAFFFGASVPLIGGAFECGINYLVYSSALQALSRRTATEHVRDSREKDQGVCVGVVAEKTCPGLQSAVAEQGREAVHRLNTPEANSTQTRCDTGGLCGLTGCGGRPQDAQSRGAQETVNAELSGPAPQEPLLHVAAAAAVAGVALSFVLAPVELIKCRLQVRCANDEHMHSR